MRVGILDILSLPTRTSAESAYNLLLTKQYASLMPQVAAVGASVAVVDFDRDGWQDFYVTNSAEGSLNRLYRNNGDGTFTDVTNRQALPGQPKATE